LGGLLGLLSTISLNTNISRIDIYGPEGIDKYVLLGRKYSYYSSYSYINYVFISSEKSASFNLNYAINFNVPFGPLFGYLKSGKNFILPDGFIIYSRDFISGYYLGHKILFINKSINKSILRMIRNATYSFYMIIVSCL